LTHVDISYNNLSPEAGANIFDAMRSNQTIRKFNVSGNLFDDNCSGMLGEFIKENDVVKDLNLSHNKLGFSAGVGICEGMLVNKAIKLLDLGYNRLAGAGTATMDIFFHFITMNYTVRTLILDGNRFGHDWAVKLSEGFSRNSTIAQISMNSTRISTESGKALVNMYDHNPYLMELGLSLDEIGTNNYERLRQIFSRKRSFKFPAAMPFQTELSDNGHDHNRLKIYDHHHVS